MLTLFRIIISYYYIVKYLLTDGILVDFLIPADGS